QRSWCRPLCWRVFVAQDSAPLGRGCGVPRAGGRQRTECVVPQGGEPRPDAGEATAAAERSGAVARAGRGRRRGPGCRTRVDRRGEELPAELQRRGSRLRRIREAKRALKARAEAEAAPEGMPIESAKPDPKAQCNFT